MDIGSKALRFYRVALACEAAADIGCGIRAKPVLHDLESNKAVAGAWLNRAGTLLAVRWKSEPSEDERIVAAALASERCVCAERMTDEQERHALMSSLARGDGWYREAQVDQLSKEEATIIAERVVQRMTGRTVLDPDGRGRLTRSIAESCYRVLTTGEPGTYASREERLRTAILGGGRSQLTDAQYAVLQQAVAIAGHRPLPNER